ncbi:hypothetical protein VBD025_08740 [Virgibacillus flavescens]|uniref:hypothetical protein n=1 Tax=Virgibacillus flavescens TaxID=1611422 RepID=UPI003D338548
MPDLMKQVVQEILQSSKPEKSRQDIREYHPAQDLPDAPLKNIKRPNHQRIKKNQRLSYDDIPSKSTKPIERNSSVSILPKQFNEASLSNLQSRSLVQGNVPKRNNTVSSGRSLQKPMSRIIGTTKNDGCVWFYPQLPENLMGSFQRALNSVAVGVVKMPECLPSHILLINEIIRNNQDVKFHISWNKDGTAPFTCELYDENIDRLEKIMNDIYQKLNRRSLKKCEAYTAISPSSWLTKQLQITPSAEAIAFLEGVSYYSGIVLMDSLLKNFEDGDFTYEISDKYILLEGNYHVISKLVTELKKEAARLVSADVLS